MLPPLFHPHLYQLQLLHPEHRQLHAQTWTCAPRQTHKQLHLTILVYPTMPVPVVETVPDWAMTTVAGAVDIKGGAEYLRSSLIKIPPHRECQKLAQILSHRVLP